ncbi:MAG: hypothetical protein Q8Q08_09005 [Candidatus Omnitrophota bacterium]|nr:hypothetical protein [Candidatus Omnitrophota bacterium]MDZ4242622.1 hypothetical protein [Candidatus Omnitrophota bacterium]
MKLDSFERFVSFDFAKITCGREITAQSGFSKYCAGRDLADILDIPFITVARDLEIRDEEAQFILYLEWDALRAAAAQYLGADREGIDRNRCLISSIEHTAEGVEVALVILPPNEMPKILPCSLGKAS